MVADSIFKCKCFYEYAKVETLIADSVSIMEAFFLKLFSHVKSTKGNNSARQTRDTTIKT